MPQRSARLHHGDEGGWLEVQADDKAKWVGAYRYLFHAGRPIIVELRVFPGRIEDAIGVQAKRSPGEWESRHGHKEAIKATPNSGLPAAVVHSLTVGRHFGMLIEGAEQLKRDLGDELFERLVSRGRLGPRWAHEPNERRGRPGKSDAWYAKLAVDYERLLPTGQVNVELAKRYRMAPSQIRDAVREACVRGLKEPAPSRGVPGGGPTQKAKDLLQQKVRGRYADELAQKVRAGEIQIERKAPARKRKRKKGRR